MYTNLETFLRTSLVGLIWFSFTCSHEQNIKSEAHLRPVFDLECVATTCREVNDTTSKVFTFPCNERADRKKHPCRLVIVYAAPENAIPNTLKLCVNNQVTSIDATDKCETSESKEPSKPSTPKTNQQDSSTETPPEIPLIDPMEKEHQSPTSFSEETSEAEYDEEEE